jgi:hypothetical protein
MASPNPERPTRVLADEVQLFTCPVCQQIVTGTITAEVFLGEMTLDAPQDGSGSVQVSVPHTTRIRGLEMPAHKCTPPPATVGIGSVLLPEDPED